MKAQYAGADHRQQQGQGKDAATTLNLRVRMSTVQAIEAAAKGRGLTMKQVVPHALKTAGVAIAEADLEDPSPRRR